MKSISSAEISKAGADFLVAVQNVSLNFERVLPPAEAQPLTLVFASKSAQFEAAAAHGALGFVVLEGVYEQTKAHIKPGMSIWTTKNISMAMSKVLGLFDEASPHLRQGLHPTAVIHPTALVSPTAHIGPYCVIGAYAKVGDHSVLTAHDYVGPYCEVGSRCLFAPFVSLGQDGFGFATDQNFNHHKIPQVGRVVVEDDCEFGAHCAVDRATLTDTRIQKGSKFDNFCHVAHNVQIGENALVTAGFIVAGSTVIGRNLMTAGGVHVVGHVKVADNVILSGRAAVTSDIEKSGMYGGFPIESHIDSVKTLSSLPHLKTLRKQVRRILKHLHLEDEA